MNGKHSPTNSSHFLQNRPNFKPETEVSTFRRVETKVIGQSLKIHVTTWLRYSLKTYAKIASPSLQNKLRLTHRPILLNFGNKKLI